MLVFDGVGINSEELKTLLVFRLVLVGVYAEFVRFTVTVVVYSGIDIREMMVIVSVTGGTGGGEVIIKLVLIIEEVVIVIVVITVCVTVITIVETDARLEVDTEVGTILWLLINGVIVKVAVGGAEKIGCEVGLIGLVLHEVGAHVVPLITVVYGVKDSCVTTGINCFPLPT